MLSSSIRRGGKNSFCAFLPPSHSSLSRLTSSAFSSFSPSLPFPLSNEIREWLSNWSAAADRTTSSSSASPFNLSSSSPLKSTHATLLSNNFTATVSTADPLSPKHFGRLNLNIELTEEFKQSWDAFHTYLSHMHRVLQDKCENKEITGFSLYLPPNLSTQYLHKINNYAQIHCLQRVYEEVNKVRCLVLTNTVFSSLEEKTFVFKMVKAAHEHRYEKVYKIFEEMKKKNLPVSVHAYNVLIELNARDYTSVKLIIDTMTQTNGLQVTKSMYTQYVIGLCLSGKYKEAEKIIFDELEQDENSLVLLIVSYSNYATLFEFHLLLKKIKEANILPSIPIVSAVFRAFGLLNDHTSLSTLWGRISCSDDTQADILSPTELPFSPSVLDTLSSSSSLASSPSSLAWPGLRWPGVAWSEFSSKNASHKLLQQQGEASTAQSSASASSTSSIAASRAHSLSTKTATSALSSSSSSYPSFMFQQGDLEAVLKLYLRAAKAFQNLGCLRETKEALQAILSIVQPLNLWQQEHANLPPFIGTVSRDWLQTTVFSAYQIVLECGNRASFPINEVELLLAQATTMGVPLRGKLLIAALEVYEAEMFRSRRTIMKGFELANAAIQEILGSSEVPPRTLVNKILQMMSVLPSKGAKWTEKTYEATEWAARVRIANSICQLSYRLIEHLHAVGFPVSRAHFNRVLQICAEHRKFYVAYKVLWQMKYFDMKPTSACWGLLLSLVHVTTNHHTLLQFHRMEMLFERYDYFPDEELANNMLRMYWKHIKDQRHATRWMGRMLKEGRTFDFLTVTRFFNKLLDDIDTSTFYLASGMMNKLPAEMKPDLHLYNTLLEAGAVLGTVGETLTLFEKLQFNEIAPDARSFSVVIGCLLKSRPSTAAQKRINALLNEMKEAGFTQEAQQIEAGEVCHMYPRLHTGPFHPDCVIWKPSASERVIQEWLKQSKAIDVADS